MSPKSLVENRISEINRHIGKSYRALGGWDKTERYFLKGYELDPHGKFMAESLAVFYSYMRDWRKAEYYIDKGIVSLPEESCLYSYKALIILMGYEDTEKAS